VGNDKNGQGSPKKKDGWDENKIVAEEERGKGEERGKEP